MWTLSHSYHPTTLLFCTRADFGAMRYDKFYSPFRVLQPGASFDDADSKSDPGCSLPKSIELLIL
jgi:hypothetical protein